MQQIFYLMMVGGGGILLILFILNIIGTDFDSGENDEFGDSNVLTIKSVTAFITGIGIGGWQSIENGYSTFAISFISLFTGIIFFGVVIGLGYLVSKLNTKERIDRNYLIGEEGEVTISNSNSNSGKMLITIDGSLREVDMIVNNNIKVNIGDIVKISKVDGFNYYVDKS